MSAPRSTAAAMSALVRAAAAGTLAALCVAAVAVAASTTAEGQPYSERRNMDLQYIRECNRTHPLSLHVMNMILVHQRLVGIGDENFKCFLHCLYTKYGWMDDEGSFLLGAMRESLQGSELQTSAANWLLYRCTATGASEPCERALKFTQCFWNEPRQVPEEDYQFDLDSVLKKLFAYPRH